VSLRGELCVVTDEGATHCGMPPGVSAASWALSPIADLPAASRVVAFENTLCALTVSSGVWCWGDNRSWGAIENSEATVLQRPVARAGLARATTLAMGTEHACAIEHDGTLLCWGRAREGQLAIAPRSPLGAPLRVPGVTEVIDVAVGARHTCLLKREGTVFCFGVNTHGQLGDGTRHARTVPTAVPGLTGVRAVRAWGDNTCALGREGRVWCWGEARNGRLGSGLVEDALTPAAVPLVRR
jgi:alpha-tubulin suppressor-like RCC1 family protein